MGAANAVCSRGTWPQSLGRAGSLLALSPVCRPVQGCGQPCSPPPPSHATHACLSARSPVHTSHRAGGGGGIGIHICRTEGEVAANFASAARQGAAAFGDAGVFVEKYVQVRRAFQFILFFLLSVCLSPAATPCKLPGALG